MGAERIQPQSEFELRVQLVKEAALELGGFPPTLIVEGNQKPIMTQFPEMPDTHEERARMMYFLGRSLAQDGRAGRLKEVWFISEAWMSMAKKGEGIQVPPSQDPNRIEVLSIMVTEVTEDRLINKGVLLEMIRDTRGRLANIQEVEIFADRRGKELKSPLLMAFFEGFRCGGIQGNSYLNYT